MNVLETVVVVLMSCVVLNDHSVFVLASKASTIPVVVSTWPFPVPTRTAWDVLDAQSGSAVDAVVTGAGTCEYDPSLCNYSVGFGGKCDENGETTLDAMIMDGITCDVGSVGCLRNVKNAIGVARAIMKYSRVSMLVGNLATDFAVSMGFPLSDLTTENSTALWNSWKNANCQPNFRENVTPDPRTSCGPYSPLSGEETVVGNEYHGQDASQLPPQFDHDTIGMAAIDKNGNIAAGTSTNGLTYKIPGRVGDSPIVGAGAYADNSAGAAVATGDGDIMMRFLPSYHAVELMRSGSAPSVAAANAIQRIADRYPSFRGAIVALSMDGQHGASCHSYGTFTYTIMSVDYTDVESITVDCT